MKEKINIFLDFDGTIVNSIKAYCDVYNQKYKEHSKFKLANPDNAYEWDMRDICPLENDVSRVFDSKEFFDNLTFIDAYVPIYIKHLQNHYNIIICTIGTNYNIHHKSKWIANNLPSVKQAIYLVQTDDSGAIVDKSLPDMSGGIIIDDNIKNLDTSNAKIKILFGKEYAFNKDTNDKYIKAQNWAQLMQILELYQLTDYKFGRD